MEKIERREFEEKKDEYQILTIGEIKEKLDKLNISRIDVSGNELWKLSNKTLSILLNSYDNPIVLKKDGLDDNVLNINPDWYLENQEVADELVRYICENINKDKFSIDTKVLIDDKLIDSLCKNKNLKIVSLAEFGDYGYFLSNDHYLKFKQSNICRVETKGVEKELEENFDFLIDYNFSKKLISNCSYNDIMISDALYINNVLTEEELHNLKYLRESNVLRLVDDSYVCIKSISSELKKLNKSNKIVIDIDNKEKFNQYILGNPIIGNNIFIFSDGVEVSLKDYLRFEKQLYEMIEETTNLSSFEKYIYAYNKVKKFKEYRENEENLASSRNLYSILENKFMVCVGFSNMFGDLLNKLGIENKYLSAYVDTSYDEAYMGEEEIEGISKATNISGHARRYIHIVDEKYGIDGFYVADPTWDNDLEHDFYNHLVMTDREVENARRYLWLDRYGEKELLNVSSIEEFYQKVNFLLDRGNKLANSLKGVIEGIINIIYFLDCKYVETLKEKYTFIDYYNWPDDITDLIYDLGEYVVSHVNKEIAGETIMSAVRNVYKNAYGYSESECDKKMEEIILENKDRQEKVFPKRYRINSDGNSEVIMNDKNKFDIEVSKISKR